MATYIENQTITYSIDLEDLGVISAVEFKFYKGNDKTTVEKFKTPTTTGYLAVSVVGTVYSFTIPSTKTAAGAYGIEMTVTRGTEVIKAQTDVGTINIKAT
jgi:hypothetical protein